LKTPSEKVAQVFEKHGFAMNVLVTEALTIANSPSSTDRKYIRIRKIADDVTGRFAEVATCRGRGCSHCCHQAVSISAWEAARIAQASGKAMEAIAGYKVGDGNNATTISAKWGGVPCPFLKDGSCSVYAERPLVCRTLISVDDNPDLCDTKKYPSGKVAFVDLRAIDHAAATVYLRDRMPMADIRDFFPS
jgi:Fe-S-cluster containining protein